MSSALSEDPAAMLRVLAEARRPALPPPPAGRIRALTASILAMRCFTVVGVPVFGLFLLAFPALFKLTTGVRLNSQIGILVWLLAISTLVAFYRAFIRGVKRAESDDIELDRQTSPRLFELLDAIAACVGTAPVARVTAGVNLGFAVSEFTTRAERGKLHLRLEAADLAGLSHAELTSILLHEFAHYGEGHTATSRRLHRLAEALFVLEQRLRDDPYAKYSPVFLAVAGFTRLFRRSYAAISRQQELQADAMAVGILGPEVFASALRKSVRNGVLIDLRIERYVEPMVEAQDLSGDFIEQMRGHAPDDDERDYQEEWISDTLAAHTGKLDHHPSFADRIAYALQAGGPAPSVGAQDAYEVLLDRRDLQLRCAAALVRRVTGRRLSAVGLRGVDVPKGSEQDERPEYYLRRLSTTAWIFFILTLGPATLLLLLFLLVAYEKPEWAPARQPLLVAAVCLVPLFLWILLLRRAGTRADHRGLTTKTAFLTIHMAWDEVSEVKMGERTTRVIGIRHEQRPSLRIGGTKRDRLVMTDMILEHAPRLAWIGWGVGLSRVERPDVHDADLPHGVTEEEEGISLEGPGQNRVKIWRQHPHYDFIREAVQRRLLPAMEARGEGLGRGGARRSAS